MTSALQISVREATPEDVPILAGLYRKLEVEMIPLEEMWPLADGLPEPIETALLADIEADESVVVIGSLEGYPFGFMIAREEALLPQADGAKVGAIRYVFVDHDAREVSVAENMRDHVMHQLQGRGITRFDAHVVPGHRLVKNFFEAGGFSARTIVMHNDGD